MAFFDRFLGQQTGGILGSMSGGTPPAPQTPAPSGRPSAVNKLFQNPAFLSALNSFGQAMVQPSQVPGQPINTGQRLVQGLGAFNNQFAQQQLIQQLLADKKAKEAQQLQFKEREFGLKEEDIKIQERQLVMDNEIRRLQMERLNKLDDLALQERQAKLDAATVEKEQKKIDQQFALQAAEESGKLAVDQIDALLSHPGFESAVGYSLRKAIPFTSDVDIDLPGGGFAQGSDAAGFAERLKQLKGGAFLQARQQLKGGGSISDTESNKAEAAVTRMSLATDENEFKEAAKEYQDIIKTGLERQRKQLEAKGVVKPQSIAGEIKFLGFE